MKCEKCGYVSSTPFQYCKNCGTKATETIPEEIIVESLTPNILNCAKSNLYLVFCILLGASTIITSINVLGILSASGLASIPNNIINLLLTIAAWLIYFDSRKNTLSPGRFKFLSICALIKYIWGYFGGAAIMLLGVVLCFFPVIPVLGSYIERLEYGLSFNLQEILAEGLLPIILFAIIGFLVVLMGVASIVLNAIGRRALYRFAKSLFKSVEVENEGFLNLKGASFWLIAYAIIHIVADFVAFFGDPKIMFMGLQRTLYYAALIVGAVMIKKYFENKNA